jgi:hypothetical protein
MCNDRGITDISKNTPIQNLKSRLQHHDDTFVVATPTLVPVHEKETDVNVLSVSTHITSEKDILSVRSPFIPEVVSENIAKSDGINKTYTILTEEVEAERLKKIAAELEVIKKHKIQIENDIKNGIITELTEEEYKKYLKPSPPVYEKHDLGFLDNSKWTKSSDEKWVHATAANFANRPDHTDMGW